MLAKQTLAKRLREARQRRRMTLKEVERLSGFSSTHISEIERGRTSPTVKALVRIAHALSKDPCYFLESRELDDVSLVSAEARLRQVPARDGLQCAALTSGILGGRVTAYLVRATAPYRGELEFLALGDACLFGLAGDARLETGDEEHSLRVGESLHVLCEEAPTLVVEQVPAEFFVAVQTPAGGPSPRGSS